MRTFQMIHTTDSTMDEAFVRPDGLPGQRSLEYRSVGITK